jgi:hypothetical protein
MRPSLQPSLPALLAAPVLLVGVGELLGQLRGLGALFVLGVVAASLPVLTPWTGRAGSFLALAPAAAMVATFAYAYPSGLTPDSPGVALFTGVLVGSPVMLLGALFASDRSAPAHLLILLAALVDLGALLGALSVSTAMGGTPTAGAFAQQFGQVFADQTQGLATLASGGTPGVLRLQADLGGVIDGLTLLALLGAFVAFLAPDEEAPEGAAPTLGPLVPVGIAAAAAAAFELAAVLAPGMTLLGLAVATVAATAGLLVLGGPWERWRASWARRGAPVRPPAAAGSRSRPPTPPVADGGR